jgi:hypothetical protein
MAVWEGTAHHPYSQLTHIEHQPAYNKIERSICNKQHQHILYIMKA